MVQEVNLYQPAFRRHETRFSSVTMLFIAVIVTVVLALIYGVSWWRTSYLRTQLISAQLDSAAAARQVEQLSLQIQARPTDHTLAQKVQEMQALVAASQQLETLAAREEYSNTAGFSAYLDALAREHVTGLWLTSFSIEGDGSHITLKGRSLRADLIPLYLQRLAREKVFDGKRFQVFQVTRPEHPRNPDSPDANKEMVAEPYLEFVIRSAPVEGAAANTS